MKACLFLFLLLTSVAACHQRPQPDAPLVDYGPAAPAFLVLAQKALSYQADGDSLAWANLLADSVQFVPNQGPARRIAKAACIAHWQRWWQANHVARIRLSHFTHLPLESRTQLELWQQPGVCVASYCVARVTLANGQACGLRFNACFHFDNARHIDGYWLYYQPLHPTQTLLTTL